MIRRRALPLALLAAISLAAAGCAASDDGDTAPSSPGPTPGATSAAAAVTCETLISPSMVSELEDAGWTSQQEVFRIGALELPDGIQCVWGDFTIVDDQLMLFGWAPIADDVSETAQQRLISEGWISEESADGRYVTENPETAISVDDEGYGITYLFGDGWVTVADTKQDLLLIERPQD